MIRSMNHLEVLESCLRLIELELVRCYWNKNQKDMESPFRNTGAHYSNGVFTVRSNSEGPNFEYRGLKVWWYKHVGRGLYWESDKVMTLEYLDKMMGECIKSIRTDFGCHEA